MKKLPRFLIALSLGLAAALSAQTTTTTTKEGPRGGHRGPHGPGRGGPGHPIVRALDTDKNGELSAAELESAPAAIRALDANADGVVTMAEFRPARPAGAPERPADTSERPAGAPARKARGDGTAPLQHIDPVMLALDADKDGALSATETANATTSLKALDENSDGKLTRDELRPLPPWKTKLLKLRHPQSQRRPPAGAAAVSNVHLPTINPLRRLSPPALWLLLLLERTPALRVASEAAQHAAPSRIVALLKAAVAGAASLGAVHSLAGATQFEVSNSNVFGTVGTPITPIAFTVTGAAIPAGSFQVSGTLPPGITATNANANGVINSSIGSLTGTPTAVGTFTVSILAYEMPNTMGDAFGPTQIGFVITNTASSAPSIVTQPASQSINSGTNVTLSVVASGSPAPTYQWRKNGTLVAGATNATLALPNVQPADAGAYTVVVSNLAGIVSSNAATLTVTAAGPTLTTQPQSQHVALGGTATFTAAASSTGLSYQWKKDGVPIAGATSSSLVLANSTAETMGFYSATVSGAGGSTNSAIAALTVNTGGPSRLVNVSTRGFIPAGGALTPGFVLQGNAAKSLVIRGIGPTLGSFGVGDTLSDPIMEIIPLGGTAAVAANDNWGGTSALREAFVQVGAFPLSAATSADASLETRLNAAGANGFTVRITPKSAAASGIALAEVYDVEAITSAVRLVNVSTSGYVGTGDKALVPGFFVGGTAPKRLLIRAIGPGLTQFGVTDVLSDPQLSVVPLGKDFTVAANDNWGGATTLQSAFTQAAAFPLPATSNDAAVVLHLPPGGYTVVVSGVGNTTGTALVEIYDLDP